MPKSIGRGKYLTIEEGQLSYVPPAKRVGPFNKGPRKRSPDYQPLTGERAAANERDRPGLGDFKSRQWREQTMLMPREKFGRPKGLSDGMSKGEMQKKNADFEKMFAVDQAMLDALAAEIGQETNPIVRLCMMEHLKVVLMNPCMREKLASLRELMTYTKAKPVQKQEIKMSEADEAWEADIGIDDVPGKGAWNN